MINLYKYAAVKKRRQLFFACQAILRTKYGMHIPKGKYREKCAVLNPIGIATGAISGGMAGYDAGGWLSNQFGLKEDDWRSQALKWGGGVLGAVGGGVVGNFGGHWIMKGLGWAGKALKGANIAGKAMNWGGKALNFGGKAFKALGNFFTGSKNVANAAKTVNTAANAAKNTANVAKTVNTATNTAKTVANTANTAEKAKNSGGWLQKGLDFASDMLSKPNDTEPDDYNSQLAGTPAGGEGNDYNNQMQQEQIQQQQQQLNEQQQTLSQMMQQFNALKAKTASIKYSRLNDLNRLFCACKCIYRLKQAGFLGDISSTFGNELLNNAIGMYSRKYDPQKEQFANNLNDSAYMQAIMDIQNGTYDGSYDANNAIRANDIQDTNLRTGYQAKAREIYNSQNAGQGVSITNNIPQGQQGGGYNGGGGYGMPMQQQSQPGLADYMREYAFNRYKSR